MQENDYLSREAVAEVLLAEFCPRADADRLVGPLKAMLLPRRIDFERDLRRFEGRARGLCGFIVTMVFFAAIMAIWRDWSLITLLLLTASGASFVRAYTISEIRFYREQLEVWHVDPSVGSEREHCRLYYLARLRDQHPDCFADEIAA
jgi:hypothetical protein